MMYNNRWMMLPLLSCSLWAAAACTDGGRTVPSGGGEETLPGGDGWRQVVLRVGAEETAFALTLADTEAARAFAARLPLTLEMTELNGNEKYARLDEPLPTASAVPDRIRTGDLMLWGDDTVVLFYDTFATSYSYTRLGAVEEADTLARALGRGGVRVTFEPAGE